MALIIKGDSFAFDVGGSLVGVKAGRVLYGSGYSSVVPPGRRPVQTQPGSSPAYTVGLGAATILAAAYAPAVVGRLVGSFAANSPQAAAAEDRNFHQTFYGPRGPTPRSTRRPVRRDPRRPFNYLMDRQILHNRLRRQLLWRI